MVRFGSGKNYIVLPMSFMALSMCMLQVFILLASIDDLAIIISFVAIFLWAMFVMPSILPCIIVIDASSHFDIGMADMLAA